MPSIVSLPGKLPEGEVRDQMATGCDWLPTIADLCGIELPDRKYDGKSILPVIRSADAPSPHDHFFWLLGRGKNAQWAVHKGDWKLLGNVRDTSNRQKNVKVDKIFLANLKSDISESQNVAAANPQVVDELTEIMQSHMDSLQQ